MSRPVAAVIQAQRGQRPQPRGSANVATACRISRTSAGVAVWKRASAGDAAGVVGEGLGQRGRAPQAEAEQEQGEQARPPGGVGGDGQHEQRRAEQRGGGHARRPQFPRPAVRDDRRASKPARAGSRQQTSSGTYHQKICARSRRAGRTPAWTAISRRPPLVSSTTVSWNSAGAGPAWAASAVRTRRWRWRVVNAGGSTRTQPGAAATRPSRAPPPALRTQRTALPGLALPQRPEVQAVAAEDGLRAGQRGVLLLQDPLLGVVLQAFFQRQRGGGVVAAGAQRLGQILMVGGPGRVQAGGAAQRQDGLGEAARAGQADAVVVGAAGFGHGVQAGAVQEVAQLVVLVAARIGVGGDLPGGLGQRRLADVDEPRGQRAVGQGRAGGVPVVGGDGRKASMSAGAGGRGEALTLPAGARPLSETRERVAEERGGVGPLRALIRCSAEAAVPRPQIPGHRRRRLHSGRACRGRGRGRGWHPGRAARPGAGRLTGTRGDSSMARFQEKGSLTLTAWNGRRPASIS